MQNKTKSNKDDLFFIRFIIAFVSIWIVHTSLDSININVKMYMTG